MIRSIAGAVWGNCNRHPHSQACALGRTLFRQIVELVQLAGKLDWDWLDGEIAPLYSDKGRPGSRTLDQTLRRCSQATKPRSRLRQVRHQRQLLRRSRRKTHQSRFLCAPQYPLNDCFLAYFSRRVR